MSRTLVIAEPGCTAEGDFEQMLRLIDAAAECGADVFKAQWTSSAQRMVERRKALDYLRFYGWLEFPIAWHEAFATRCAQRGIAYACSVYLPEDAATVSAHVKFLKISSFEADDAALVSACRRAGPPVIVSYGLGRRRSYKGDIELHCVSAYPAPLESLNLWCINYEHESFDGLSDHSRHLLAGALTVAMGGSVVETHYRLDDCDPRNPDYAVSFSPSEFAQYVRYIRDAEVMLGGGVKRVQDCEQPMLRYRVEA